MFSLSLSAVFLAASLARAQVTGTFPPTPLYSKHFPHPTDLPEKVDTDQGLIRGTQFGYNICNSTTEGPTSLCQTSYVNGIEDFCLWSTPTDGKPISETEGETVAYCSKKGYGTRVMAAGTIKGLQVIKTPSYISYVGFIDQTLLGLPADDFGGELDPHGADLRGNPMGGVVYSKNFTSDGLPTQVPDWNLFIGGGGFCMKICDPADPNAARYCENRLDRIGCAYNLPSNAQTGTFEVCEGDNMEFPGVYTSNGATLTYAQPAESLGPITTVPYTPVVPSSSNCVTYTSAQIYTDLVAPSGATSSGASGSAPTAAGQSTSTATGRGAGSTDSPNDASALAVSGISLLGVVFASLFFS
ncbi:hypothetical protein Agabi119p4_4975 [Agaricus bisporus var. burnettii]|uniref:Uncharacterized protein n=1 Tax=Agaricus bisporus var. burnettii TaxID=192524 RepID=A0A8H7KHT7_AGABI|nr:hypothetical protein Agabi119p4_4975 [Agaricus bisporus var. burnettii]